MYATASSAKSPGPSSLARRGNWDSSASTMRARYMCAYTCIRSSALARGSLTMSAPESGATTPAWRPVISAITAVCIDASDGRADTSSGRTAALLLRVQADAGPMCRAIQLALELFEGGDMRVPLDHRRARSEALDRLRVELPDLGPDVPVVRVDQERALFRVAGEVDLADALRGHRRDVGAGVEAVVVGADEDVVDVEQDAAVSAAGQLGEKLVLLHVGVPEAHVARRILEQDAAAEAFLYRLHAAPDVRGRPLGVRHRWG